MGELMVKNLLFGFYGRPLLPAAYPGWIRLMSVENSNDDVENVCGGSMLGGYLNDLAGIKFCCSRRFYLRLSSVLNFNNGFCVSLVQCNEEPTEKNFI